MTDIPIVLSASGRVNTSPAVLLNELITLVASTNPGYTANLPGSLIEDISSTDVGALVVMDQAVTELINSLTPFGANAWLLLQLGQIYGVTVGQTVNTSVYVTFTGTVGFVIPKGFTVSDGTYQYVVQDGAVVGSTGISELTYCVSTTAGNFAVPANTVTHLVTSVPSTITLAVTNPQPGTPSSGSQTEAQYRAQVLQAGQAVATGMPAFLKTLLNNVPGVQPRLVAIQQQTGGGGWKVIVGGGDPYSVARAIYEAIFDISTLAGSKTFISGITNANPGVVTTTINHGLTTGQANVYIAGVLGMTGANGGPYTVTVLTPTTFSFGVNTTSLGTYTSGGIVTPNTRSVTVSIDDYPDTYAIPITIPPAQTVAIALTWNTNSINIVSPAAVSQAAIPALVTYINSLYVGQPINLFELQTTFQVAIANIVPPQQLTRMVFAVSIDGVGTPVETGTGIIAGDSESYFITNSSLITVSQG